MQKTGKPVHGTLLSGNPKPNDRRFGRFLPKGYDMRRQNAMIIILRRDRRARNRKAALPEGLRQGGTVCSPKGQTVSRGKPK